MSKNMENWETKFWLLVDAEMPGMDITKVQKFRDFIKNSVLPERDADILARFPAIEVASPNDTPEVTLQKEGYNMAVEQCRARITNAEGFPVKFRYPESGQKAINNFVADNTAVFSAKPLPELNPAREDDGDLLP